MADKPAVSQFNWVVDVSLGTHGTQLLGVRRLQRWRAARNILESAEKALRWLWICREGAWCVTGPQVGD